MFENLRSCLNEEDAESTLIFPVLKSITRSLKWKFGTENTAQDLLNHSAMLTDSFISSSCIISLFNYFTSHTRITSPREETLP
jgi:hypothetical protein